MAATHVTVRAATAGDVPAIAALLAAGSLTPDAEDAEDHGAYAAALSRVRAGGGEVFVAVLDGAVVGVLQALVLEHLQHRGGRACELESVHVAEAHRGSGIGAALLAVAVEWARDRGCYRVQLTSNNRRPDAHRFYSSHGFTPSHVGFRRDLSA